MKGLAKAFWTESLKARRSKILWIIYCGYDGNSGFYCKPSRAGW
jgi:hypothetical protein